MGFSFETTFEVDKEDVGMVIIGSTISMDNENIPK